MPPLIILAVLVAACGLLALILSPRTPRAPDQPPSIEIDTMSKVTDAFAAYVAFRDQKEAAAVATAVAAATADAASAVDASETADAGVILSAIPADAPVGQVG